MPRRDPFENLTLPSADRHSPSADAPGTPPSPLDLIPRAKPKKRRREWERRHKSYTYWVSGQDLVTRAKAVRESIRGLAEAYMTTTDQVAEALMSAALDAVRDGEIELQVQPNSNPKARRMTVEVVREPGWKRDIPRPKGRSRKITLVLAYRWSKEMHQRIVTLAGNARIGEVVVTLLEEALERVRKGIWTLRPRVVAITQETQVEVNLSNSWKIGGSSSNLSGT